MNGTTILGISAYYHDSAATILDDGKIVAAAQEERFTRKKHDPSFPSCAIEYCLNEAGISLADVSHCVFYDKPLLKFERLLESYIGRAPLGLRSFLIAMPIWLKEKLFLKETLRRELAKLPGGKSASPRILFSSHHHSHAASAFYPSPFDKSVILCLDGVGEWATSSVWFGKGSQLTPQWEIQFPHSLGLLYSAFTYYTGFKVNSGEYKLMGLAPYGKPKYVDLIMNNIIDIKSDGTFHLDQSYFNYTTGLTMTSERFHRLFGGPPRAPESSITQKDMDIARSIQAVTEEIVLRLAKALHLEFKCDNLCLAGGVALNCVANGRLKRESPFKNIWIQPAAGDAGGSLGACLIAWHEYLGKPRDADRNKDSMHGSFLGPSYTNEDVARRLTKDGAVFEVYHDSSLFPLIARHLDKGAVVGWFNGKMEFGPRALGARSILGDPRKESMQSTMNLKIKYRESFRPFAPAVKFDKVSEWFDWKGASPYMLNVSQIAKDQQISGEAGTDSACGLEALKLKRSKIPAVTHVDRSARIQTVHPETNPRFYKLLDAFETATGCPVLINTSFNVRGEPIVQSPEDAYRCFMGTEMDVLVVENAVLFKRDQPAHLLNKFKSREIPID